MEWRKRRHFEILAPGSSVRQRVDYSLAIVRLILVPVMFLAVYYLFEMGRIVDQIVNYPDRAHGTTPLRPPVNDVTKLPFPPPKRIEPAVSPGRKPKEVSFVAGLMAVPPNGVSSTNRLIPTRKLLAVVELKMWFSSSSP
jgi:hypothetical protein